MLSIILPCYNEAENIPILWNLYEDILQRRKDVEVVFVDNGSTDNTAKILDYLFNKTINKSIFRKVKVEHNKGYGFGILSGLKEASGDVLAWTHADLQTNPMDVLHAYDIYNEKNDDLVFVKGKRFNRSFHAWIFSFGMQVISNWLLRNRMDEINAQPKLFSREFYKKYLIDKAPLDFSIDLFACYYAYQIGKIVEFPVKVARRKFGDAKGGGSILTKLKLIIKTLNYIFKMKSTISKPNTKF